MLLRSKVEVATVVPKQQAIQAHANGCTYTQTHLPAAAVLPAAAAAAAALSTAVDMSSSSWFCLASAQPDMHARVMVVVGGWGGNESHTRRNTQTQQTHKSKTDQQQQHIQHHHDKVTAPLTLHAAAQHTHTQICTSHKLVTNLVEPPHLPPPVPCEWV